MNVDRPDARSSDAPTRVQTRSTIGNLADVAGTNDPIWASIWINAICRKIVDLPPIFAPVIISRRSVELLRQDIIWYERCPDKRLDYRMAAVLDLDLVAIVQYRTNIIVGVRRFPPSAHKSIQRGKCPGRRLQLPRLAADLSPDL